MKSDCRRFISGKGLIKGRRLLGLILLAVGVNRASAKDGSHAAAPIRNPSSIVLDGRLDEPEWRDAPVLRLVQQSPKPGAATPYETEVRIIVSGDRIFFGCFALAVAGFKKNLWLTVAGLAGHGVFDFFHHLFINNTGVPLWWPDFCLSFDVLAGGFLAMLLMQRSGFASKA